MVTPLQKFIVNQMEVLPEIDPAQEYRRRVNFLKDYLLGTGLRGFVLGVSGGQDSALVSRLCADATRELREQTGDNSYKFVAMLLPYGVQADAYEAEDIAYNFSNADEVVAFNIKDTVDAFENTFNRNTLKTTDGTPKILLDYHKGNVKARTRMMAQYAIAGQEKLLVASSDHSSESITGFFTIHGDGGADIAPIFGLNKRQGKQILRFLDAPEWIFVKKPTADLLDGNPQQEDEAELGLEYRDIDDYLELREVEQEKAAKLEQRFLATEFKRRPPVTLYDTWVEEYKNLAE
jgi:NAD+ synthase